MNRNAVKRNCLCAVKRSTMSEFFEFPQKQLINISVSIVEILPRRTFVRRRSAFGDSSSFLTPPDNRKAQTETENFTNRNCLCTVKRSRRTEFFEFPQKQLYFCFYRRKSPLTYPCTPSVGFRRLGIFFNAPPIIGKRRQKQKIHRKNGAMAQLPYLRFLNVRSHVRSLLTTRQNQIPRPLPT